MLTVIQQILTSKERTRLVGDNGFQASRERRNKDCGTIIVEIRTVILFRDRETAFLHEEGEVSRLKDELKGLLNMGLALDHKIFLMMCTISSRRHSLGTFEFKTYR